MINIETERVIPVRDVRKHVPSRCPGKCLSPATIWRWTRRKTNPLETVLIGGGRFTSIEAIARFIEAGSTPPSPAMTADAARPTSSPTGRSMAAGEELKKLIDPRGGPRA